MKIKPVKGLEGKYEVTSDGDVYSLNYNKTGIRKRLSPGVTTGGYLQVHLQDGKSKRPLKVHRIVLEAFTDVAMKKTVNHKNGVRTDNRLSNLEWATSSENVKHSYDVLGRKKFNGVELRVNKLSEEEVIEILHLKGKLPQKQIAKMYNVDQSNISYILTGKTWGHLQCA